MTALWPHLTDLMKNLLPALSSEGHPHVLRFVEHITKVTSVSKPYTLTRSCPEPILPSDGAQAAAMAPVVR